ncbi:MAG TPA: hypothetical protein VGM54_12900 [Chthoniobacter sp.]|jgi:hypothetical protein
MALPHQPPADAGPLERFVRKAIWRIRLERLRLALGVMVWISLAAATIWTAGLLWRPQWALAAPIGIAVIGALLFVAADVALFWQVDRRSVLLRLDRQLGLADATISASELTGDIRDDWRWRQLAQTVNRLSTRSWDERWPRRWPGLVGLGAATLAVLCALLLAAWRVERVQAQPGPTPFQKAQFQALEEVFKDWDEAAKKTNDPKLQEQLALMKPLREQMLSGKIDDKEVLAALSRLEEKLQAAREQIQAQSLEPSAAELASALEPFQGMSAMAASLRRKDFGQAEKLAQELAEKLNQPGAKLPEGADQRENQLRLANTAQTMQQRGQNSVSQALQKMEQGMQNANNQQTSEGLDGLKKNFGDQAKRDAEKQRLATQLAQMGAAKDSLGSGKSVARGMSLLPRLADSKQHGNGAGSEIDPHRFGAETNIASNRTEEKVTGETSDGDSVITTEKSREHSKEAPTSVHQANFHEYEKLSREAIEDESIPLAHREAIRKYFEMIRPAEK